MQADLKVFHRFRVFGTSAITAVTAQHTRGVMDWHAVEPALVRAQMAAVAEDLRPRAIKSGMMGNAAVARTVADTINNWNLHPYVLDPVLIATSGDALSTPDLVAAIQETLIPLADIITPNVPEAVALTGLAIHTVADMKAAAKHLVHRMGARAVLVKGGHLGEATSATVVDVWYDGQATSQILRSRRVGGGGPAVHGTGCTLSAAITARLALGDMPLEAVKRARTYVHRALRGALSLGGGARPLNHWA